MGNKIRVALISPSGEISIESIDADPLADLQRLVGGWVELINLGPEVTGWLNEEGRILDLPGNPCGTRVLKALGWSGDGYAHVRGPLVITGRRMVARNDVGEEEEEVTHVPQCVIDLWALVRLQHPDI